jgi:hypothetical protein
MMANICTDIQAYSISLANPPPYFPLSLHSAPFYMTRPLFLLTWRTSFFCSWCEYSSTLVPGLLSTGLPLLLHPPQDTPQIKLDIYIDDINNVSRSVWHTYTLWCVWHCFMFSEFMCNWCLGFFCNLVKSF